DDEAKAQSGERSKHYAEIGWSKNQEVAKTNPKLVAMNKKFGMIHGLSSIARIFKLICLLLYIGLDAGCIHFRLNVMYFNCWIDFCCEYSTFILLLLLDFLNVFKAQFLSLFTINIYENKLILE
ncbi:hypothetical protein ES288_A10G134600v1, partial [Gossypium darwinii]